MPKKPAKPLLERAGFIKVLFDAIPSAAFVMDADVRVLHANRAASEMLGGDAEKWFLSRGGEAIKCINAEALGCGRSPACEGCVIRGAVSKAFEGGSVQRKNSVFALGNGDSAKEVHFLVTAAPFAYRGRQLSLLILEDVSELVRLRGLVPVCAWCRRVRDDEDYWHNVEDYLSSRLDIQFTHGICGECMERVLTEDKEDA